MENENKKMVCITLVADGEETAIEVPSGTIIKADLLPNIFEQKEGAKT